MKLIPLLLFLLLSTNIQAQEVETVKTNKGKIYAFWGWNRGWFTNSDIHFTGDNYDFTLNDIEARDRQSKLGLDPYLNIGRITIPQYNFRIGYFINNNIDISIGVDHMKYVMDHSQQTEISGNIDNGSNYDGTYNNTNFDVDQNFLKFEHTDGLNYLNVEATYNKNLLALLKIRNNPNKIEVNYIAGIGLGALMPRSNVTLMSQATNDEFHFAGYGFGAKTGLDITFFKFFFLRTEYKGGFINMPDIRTTAAPKDKASQHFWFGQLNFNFGISFNPFN
jgi:hypothetical protein